LRALTNSVRLAATSKSETIANFLMLTTYYVTYYYERSCLNVREGEGASSRGENTKINILSPALESYR
jgi:hypothetical protein